MIGSESSDTAAHEHVLGSRRDKILVEITKRRGRTLANKVWLSLYLATLMLFAFFAYRSMCAQVALKKSTLFFVSMFTAYTACAHISITCTAERCTDPITYTVIAKTGVLLVCSFLLFAGILSQSIPISDQNDSAVLAFIFIQSVFYIKALSLYFSKLISIWPFFMRRRAMELSTVLLGQTDVIVVQMFISLAFTLLRVLPFCLHIRPSVLLREPFYFLFTFFFSLWSHHIAMAFGRVYLTSLLYLVTDRNSRNTALRNQVAAQVYALEQLGAAVQMGMYSLVFSLADLARCIFLCSLWPVSAKRVIESALKKTIPGTCEIYEESLPVLAPFVALHRCSLSEAVAYAKAILPQMSAETQMVFRSNEIRGMPLLQKAAVFTFIGMPLALLFFVDKEIPRATFLKILGVLVWCTASGVPFFCEHPDVVCKNVLLLSSEGMGEEDAAFDSYARYLLEI
jgi:hypothetical protein